MKIITRILIFLIYLILLTTHAHAVRSGGVVINELMWMGSSASSYDEWIELRNVTDGDINLSDWEITKLKSGEEILMLTIPSGKVIPANGYFLISNYDDGNPKSKIDIEPDVVDTNVSLANSTLQIKIYDSGWNNGGVLIDTADDGSGEPFAGDNTNKYSMERRNPPGDGTISSNWQTASDSLNWDATATEQGTPKQVNSLDLSPPSAISDLVACWGDNDGEIVLTWTAPTEDISGGGKVSYYDMRYASFSFTGDDWSISSVEEVLIEPEPETPGSQESIIISDLKPGVVYYFAIKSGDNEGQVSLIDTKTQEDNQAFCVARGIITLKITEVSFASGNDWVELYNWGEEDIDISGFMLTDLDGEDSTLAIEGVTLKPAQYAVIQWNDEGDDETDITGDTNDNSYIDLYVSDTGLSSTDDEVVLISAGINGDYIDAVCWSNLDGVYNNTDLILLVDKLMWTAQSSFSETDCWTNNKEVNSDSSIGRKPPFYEDINSKDDWYLYPTSTPGGENLFLQIISPEDGTIIEQTSNIQVIPEICLGEVEYIDFMYRKKGARNWQYIAQSVKAPFYTDWDAAEFDIGSYELQLFANNVCSSVILVTLIKAEEPDTIITLYPEMLVNTRDVIFEFSGEDNLTSAENLAFSYKLNNEDWKEIGNTKSVILENLKDSEHVFSVKAKDKAGYEDVTPAVYTFTVDATCPEVLLTAPREGDKIAGNAVPIRTESIDSDIDSVIFQYRLPTEDWQDIEIIRKHPFNIFWDVSNLTNNTCYELRLEATDKAGNISNDLTHISVIINFDEPNYGGSKVFIEPDQGGSITDFDGTKINIPPGGIKGTEPVEISIVKLKPELLNQSQDSHIKATGIAKEFLLNNSQHFLEDGKSAEVTFYYPEDEIIDLGIEEETLKLFYWDDEVLDWELISNSQVYPEENCIKAEISHFSIYQIMGYIPESSIDSVYAFPNPCYYPIDQQIKFSKLSDFTEEIFIYNLNGELIKKLSIDSANLDNISWECNNESGEIVASGVYFCLIKTGAKKKVIKVVVIK